MELGVSKHIGHVISSSGGGFTANEDAPAIVDCVLAAGFKFIASSTVLSESHRSIGDAGCFREVVLVLVVRRRDGELVVVVADACILREG